MSAGGAKPSGRLRAERRVEMFVYFVIGVNTLKGLIVRRVLYVTAIAVKSVTFYTRDNYDYESPRNQIPAKLLKIFKQGAKVEHDIFK